jgi:hypothetical protein
MSAVRVQPVQTVVDSSGVGPFILLTPVCVLACLMISGLAYSTVGFSLRDNTPHEEALLATARTMHTTGGFGTSPTVPAAPTTPTGRYPVAGARRR